LLPGKKWKKGFFSIFLEPFFDFFGKVNFLFKEGFYYPSSYSYK